MTIPDGFGQVTHLFSGGALPEGAAITHHIELGTALFPESVAEYVAVEFHAALVSEMPATVVYDGALVKFGPTATGPSAFHAMGFNGTYAQAPAPPNTAYLVRKNTNFGGRSGSGRMFLPFATDINVLDGGLIQSERRTFLQTAINVYFGKLQAEGLDMVLLRKAPLDPATVTGLNVDNRAATQRRRLR